SDPASGDAVSICGDAKTCDPSSGSCTSEILDGASLPTYAAGDEEHIPTPSKEGGVATSTCGPSQKSCSGTCANQDDPRYGCSPTSCEPCSGGDPLANYVCAGGTCKASGCTAGYKECGGTCVLADAAHGCTGTSCEPCAGSAAGTTACDAAGACTLACSSG